MIGGNDISLVCTFKHTQQNQIKQCITSTASMHAMGKRHCYSNARVAMHLLGAKRRCLLFLDNMSLAVQSILPNLTNRSIFRNQYYCEWRGQDQRKQSTLNIYFEEIMRKEERR